MMSQKVSAERVAVQWLAATLHTFLGVEEEMALWRQWRDSGYDSERYLKVMGPEHDVSWRSTLYSLHWYRWMSKSPEPGFVAVRTDKAESQMREFLVSLRQGYGGNG